MAEVLVMAIDTANAGTDPGAYAEGDVVYVGEDGHGWGKEELDTTKFRIVHISGKAETIRLRINAPYIAGGQLFSPSRWRFLQNKFVDKDSGDEVYTGKTSLLK